MSKRKWESADSEWDDYKKIDRKRDRRKKQTREDKRRQRLSEKKTFLS